ncbi:uncharacterized protein [Rutidosis leptorrhynchoides]|uniref:uncharacterized protein n=1 Tax=Rutidosis leptorrhynchoides TaxID=125765 RepID=UPI003A992FA5
MREFKECVDALCMSDVNYSGLQFTWNQRPQSNDGILKKIDRIMANDAFFDRYTNAVALFQPYHISDHSPAVLKILSDVKQKHPPFKFSNYITNHELFMSTVSTDSGSGSKRCQCVGDSPSARDLAANSLKNYNDAIHEEESDVMRGQAVQQVFVNHYKDFLGKATLCEEIDTPGPDGYTTAFLKKSWDVIGPDVIKGVQEFFLTGQLLKEINCTILSLLPKVQTPSKVMDYRPIACCNLMRNYHLNRGTPRCAFKVDIQKAYDTVDWEFLNVILICFGFPVKMIINLCFADDLFLFSRVDLVSISVIRDSLEKFKRCSGLVPSLPKSTAFFSNVSNLMKSRILEILPFDEGKLPIRYLGVPLVSSRPMYRDCKVLVDRVKHKVDD